MHRNIVLLRIFYFFWGFNMFAPVAIIYFQHLTHSYTLALSIFTVTLFASSLFEVPTSIISDMVGRKITMLLGTVATIVAFVMLFHPQSLQH